MLRLYIALLVMPPIAAPVAAETDADVHDGLVHDLRGAICSSTLGVDARTVELSALLRVVSDAARLDAAVAEKQLAADLAVAAGLNGAASANQGRSLYIQHLHQAVARYQQALNQAQATWTQDSAQAYNENQVDVAHLIQTTQVDLANALQRAQEGILRGPQVIAPLGSAGTAVTAGAFATAGAEARVEVRGAAGGLVPLVETRTPGGTRIYSIDPQSIPPDATRGYTYRVVERKDPDGTPRRYMEWTALPPPPPAPGERLDARTRLAVEAERGERKHVPAPIGPTDRGKPPPPADPARPTALGIEPVWRSLSCDEQSLAIISDLERAIAQARQRYVADVTGLASACDDALAQAARLASTGDMEATMSAAVREFGLLARDRHDRYALEVRTAARAIELPPVRADD